MQTKLQSLIEMICNYASGFVVAFLTWHYMIPVFWPHLSVPASQGVWVTVVFTIVSITRSYLWRRLFNHLHTRK